MKVAGLFAGIGGFERGLTQAGHETAFMCEIDPAARAVLEKRFPDVPLHDDVRTLQGLPKNVEILTAGFPCQDLSQAGCTKGLEGSDSNLVFEVFRLLEKRRIPWVVLENVPFMLHLRRGAAMRTIVDELEALGYRWAWRIVDTYSFGLPQRRQRVFLVASTVGDPADVLLVDDKPITRPETSLTSRAHGFYWTEGTRGLGWAVDSIPTLKNGSKVGIPSAPAIMLTDGVLITPDVRDAERLQGFPKGWTRPAENVTTKRRRWALVGSAVTIKVSAWLGRRIADPDIYDDTRDRPFDEASKLPKAARYDGVRRYAVDISIDPIGKRPVPLEKFLSHEGNLLSHRATAGFLSRARNSKLRFAEGFLDRVETHLTNITALDATDPHDFVNSR